MGIIKLEKMPFIKRSAIPWIIWGIVGLYYLYEITLRVLPSTMRPQLIDIFQINATEFGIMSGTCYYITYVLMQIPCGLTVDRFSIRKTLFVASLLCISGLFLMHATTHVGMAYLGRMVIGFGSAFAYVYTLKVATIWLPRRHFGLATCIADSLGMIGAMFADTVFVEININSGIHQSVNILLVVGLVVASLIFFVFRDKKETRKTIELNKQDTRDASHIFHKITRILSNPQIWLIGLVGCLFYLPASVFADTWGIPYLKKVYHVNQEHAGWIISTFLAGWVIAGPFLGMYSDKIRARVMPMKLTILACAILFSVLIFVPPVFHVIMPEWVLYGIFLLIGISVGTHPLIFALAKENFPIRIAGTVVAVINTLTMLGGVIITPLVGLLIDYSHGSIHATGAVTNYTSHNYTLALALVPISLFVSYIIMMFIKETGSHIEEDVEDEVELEDPSVLNKPALEN